VNIGESTLFKIKAKLPLTEP